MANTLKTTTANSALDNIYDTLFGASPVCEIRSGAGAGPDNAAGGTLGVSITAPATAFSAAASKSKSKTGTWSAAASTGITAGHYRLRNTGDTVREEGTITITGSGGDMTLDNTSITATQVVTVTGYTRTLP
jgi:hypothetical protein